MGKQYLQGKTEVSKSNLSQCHHVHHHCHIDCSGIEHVLPRWRVSYWPSQPWHDPTYFSITNYLDKLKCENEGHIMQKQFSFWVELLWSLSIIVISNCFCAVFVCCNNVKYLRALYERLIYTFRCSPPPFRAIKDWNGERGVMEVWFIHSKASSCVLWTLLLLTNASMQQWQTFHHW